MKSRVVNVAVSLMVIFMGMVAACAPCVAQAPPSYSPGQFGFGDFTNGRPLPTICASCSGTYRTAGDWVQTGTVTCDHCKLYFGGSVTINGTFNTDTGGIGPDQSSAYGYFLRGSGTTPFVPFGAGGAHVANGGQSIDSGGQEALIVQSGLGQVLDDLPLFGSGGTLGLGTSAGIGGNGGGDLYIEASGPVHLTSTASIQLPGTAGAASATASNGGGGGGAGGGVDIRSLSTITVDTGSQIHVEGGAGGNDTATGGRGGGGGAGGIVELLSAISTSGVTNNGTQFTTAGAAGTGAAGNNGSAGSAGALLNSNTYGFPGPRRRWYY